MMKDRGSSGGEEVLDCVLSREVLFSTGGGGAIVVGPAAPSEVTAITDPTAAGEHALERIRVDLGSRQPPFLPTSGQLRRPG